MFTIYRPTSRAIEALRLSQARLAWNYGAVGMLAANKISRDYSFDRYRIQIGSGLSDFEMARAVLSQWQMFPSWVKLYAEKPAFVGQTVIIIARVCGLYFGNACRVINIEASQWHYSITYGTLPHHVESGEEKFSVMLDADGSVWYSIEAASRPHWWPLWLFYPIVRLLQAHFRRTSGRAVLRQIHEYRSRTEPGSVLMSHNHGAASFS